MTRALACSLGHIDMPARAKHTAQADDTDVAELPSFNGSQLDGARWLRELDDTYHLFDADISFHLSTATSITNSGKTTVVDAHQAVLLKHNLIKPQRFGIFNPPPIIKGFKELYEKVRRDLANGSSDPMYAGIDPNDFPADPPAVSDPYLLAPDRAQQLDLKLRNEILSLITSTGRRRHYRNQTQSGCKLLELIYNDSKATAHSYTQDPNNVRLKAELRVVMKKTLTHTSQVEFDEIRDAIEGINDQLPIEDKVTSHQLCDHYLKLIRDLGNVAVISALDTELKMSQVTYGDAQSTVDCIVRTLTNQLVVAECASLEANGNFQGNSGRAMLTHDKTGDQLDNGSANKTGSDPKKSTINKSGGLGGQNKPPPDYECKLCGRNHFENRCFKNPNADDSTKKWAARVAPTSPAAKSWRALNKTNEPPSKGSSNSTNNTSTKPKAAAETDKADKMEDKAGAALAAHSASTATGFSNDELMSALDNEEPTAFILGRAAIARADTTAADLFCPANLTAVRQHWLDQCVDDAVQEVDQPCSPTAPEPADPAAAVSVARAAELGAPAVQTEQTDRKGRTDRPVAPKAPRDRAHMGTKAAAPAPTTTSALTTTFKYAVVAIIASVATMAMPSMLKAANLHQGLAAGEFLAPSCTHAMGELSAAVSATLFDFFGVASFFAAQMPLIALMDAATVTAFYVTALMLKAVRLLCQATRQALKPKPINNTFTRQLRGLSVELKHLKPSWSRTTSFMFSACHVLLLLTVLCPLSRLVRVEDNAGESFQENVRLEWRGPAVNLRSCLPLASKTAALCLAISSDCLTPPTLNYEPTLTSCAKVILIALANGAHPLSGTLNSIIHGTFISNSHIEDTTTSLTSTANISLQDLQTDHGHDLPPSAGRLLLSALKGEQTIQSAKKSSTLNMIIDSGASYHIHHNLSDLINIRPCRNRLFGVDHQEHICTKMGDLKLLAADKHGILHDILITGVRYAPNFKDTLLSVAQLWRTHTVDTDTVFRNQCQLASDHMMSAHATNTSHSSRTLIPNYMNGVRKYNLLMICAESQAIPHAKTYLGHSSRSSHCPLQPSRRLP